MMIVLFLILILFTIIGFYISRDLFAPFVIMPAVWCIIFLLYFLLPNNYYQINYQFPIALLVWTSAFCFSAIFSTYKTQPASIESIEAQPNIIVLKVYRLLSYTITPVVLILTLIQAITEDPENIFRYIRIMNTGQDESIEPLNLGPALYFIAVAYIMLFFSLLYDKTKKAKIGIFLLNLLLAFVTMAKTTFLCVFFSTLFILYKKKVVTIKAIALGMLMFIAFSIILQTLRTGDSGDMMESSDFFSIYLLSSSVAFDHFAVPMSAHHFGEHTFRLFYAIQSALGIEIDVAEVILPLVSIPDLTNTYTILYPFYIDFGLLGVLIFGGIYGLTFGYLYKKQASGGNFQLILYAIFLNYLLIGFIGEFIFTNISQTIQYVVFAALPFLLNGNNYRHTLGNVQR